MGDASSDAAAIITRVEEGYVDAEGWARHASGAPVSSVDACGVLPLREAAATNHIPSVTVDHPLAPVTSKYSYKFFHWIVEALPRVGALLAAEPQLRTRWRADQPGNQLQLLVSCKGSVIRESLQLLGVDRSRVLCWRPGRVFRSSADLLFAPPAPCGGAKSSALRALRHVALPPSLRPLPAAGSSAPASSSDAILLLMHKRDGTRRLRNHEALLAALAADPRLAKARVVVLRGGGGGGTSEPAQVGGSESRRGNANDRAGSVGAASNASSSRTSSSNTPLREQIRLFRGASCQVGPHGAGMALMLFAPQSFGTAEVGPGAYFVSIRGKPGARDVASGRSLHLNRGRNRTSRWVGEPTPNACYRGLAATLGMKHEWVIVPGATANDDLAPEPEAVVSMAARMCAP